MAHQSSSDLTSLAELARRADSEIRPLLLRVKVQDFAAASVRTAASVQAFEAIALGLIPLVTDDVLAEAAALLRDVVETPDTVRDAIRHRIVTEADPQTLSADSVSESDEPDTSQPLTGRRLDDIIEAAQTRRDLARTLLARSDLGAFQRAALYRFATEPERRTIREALAAALAASPNASAHRAPRGLRALILEAASRQDLDGLLELIGHRSDDPAEGGLDLTEPADQELFVLALIALGLETADCLQVVLALALPLSREVGTVFRLAALARSVPPSAAAYLVGHDRPARRAVECAGSPPGARRTPSASQDPAGASGRSERPSRSSIAIHQRS